MQKYLKKGKERLLRSGAQGSQTASMFPLDCLLGVWRAGGAGSPVNSSKKLAIANMGPGMFPSGGVLCPMRGPVQSPLDSTDSL